MFSLFQDNGANTSIENGSTNDAPLNNHDITAGVGDSKIVLERDPTSQKTSQDAWCSQVQRLKQDFQTPPTNKKAAFPFHQFYSKRPVAQAVLVSPDQDVVKLPTSETTKTTFAQAVLVSEEDQEVAAKGMELPEVRHVRFQGQPKVVDYNDANDAPRKKRGASSKKQGVYWTRHEVECMKTAALQSARAFRTERPATVKRLKQLFEDFCWQQSNEIGNSSDVDEESEEILHRFLVDWGLSTVRGLEERVVPRKVFDQDRRMAQESVLAYQQLLREGGIHSPSEMEAMLSIRSESASRRARMFAMYMALGDALAVAAFQEESEESCGSDGDFF